VQKIAYLKKDQYPNCEVSKFPNIIAMKCQNWPVSKQATINTERSAKKGPATHAMVGRAEKDIFSQYARKDLCK
jgi:hypothetical protein